MEFLLALCLKQLRHCQRIVLFQFTINRVKNMILPYTVFTRTNYLHNSTDYHVMLTSFITSLTWFAVIVMYLVTDAIVKEILLSYAYLGLHCLIIAPR